MSPSIKQPSFYPPTPYPMPFSSSTSHAIVLYLLTLSSYHHFFFLHISLTLFSSSLASDSHFLYFLSFPRGNRKRYGVAKNYIFSWNAGYIVICYHLNIILSTAPNNMDFCTTTDQVSNLTPLSDHAWTVLMLSRKPTVAGLNKIGKNKQKNRSPIRPRISQNNKFPTNVNNQADNDRES